MHTLPASCLTIPSQPFPDEQTTPRGVVFRNTATRAAAAEATAAEATTTAAEWWR